MLLLLFSTLVLLALSGFVAFLVSYSLWRRKFYLTLPGSKPCFYNVLGDFVKFSPLDRSSFNESIDYKFFKFLITESETYKKYPLFCVWAAYMPFVILTKSQAVKDLLKSNKHLDKSWIYRFFEPVCGTGLFTSDTAKWKSRRKLIMPCFNNDALKDFLVIFNKHSERLVDYLQADTKKDFTLIKNVLVLSTLDVICETVFGVSVNALDNSESQFNKAVRGIANTSMNRIYKVWQWPDFLFNHTSAGKSWEKDLKVFKDFTRRIIQDKKVKYQNGVEDRDTRMALLDHLVRLHVDTGQLNEDDIEEEINTFAVAGHDTAAIGISWCVYMIGLHPEIQAKIHEELDRIFENDPERHATMDDINDMHYLESVLKESNRLYPPAPIFARQVHEDAKIAGYTIPKGTSCMILAYTLHRDEEVYPDPEKFDPERFSAENAAKIPEGAYAPFALGPRNCIGQWYAMLELKAMLSHILRHYTIESLDPRESIVPIISITLHPSSPFRVRFRPRPARANP
ncbi:cytochrome P450 4V2 [Caerostris darwini]|uniref:Cytochrome P450 4V2 n=1 Tax=Caerostris darwini TaxID=1538125 RepID=A0AAV4N1C6_9ARAC|nr:cytochrome P450 4V2 [Caerostris darwini]